MEQKNILNSITEVDVTILDTVPYGHVWTAKRVGFAFVLCELKDADLLLMNGNTYAIITDQESAHENG